MSLPKSEAKSKVEAQIVLFDHDCSLTRRHTNSGFDGEGHGFGFLKIDEVEPGDIAGIETYRKFLKEMNICDGETGKPVPIPTVDELKRFAIGKDGIRKNYEKNGKHPIIIKHIINKLQKIGKSVGIVSHNEGTEADTQKDKHSGISGRTFVLNSLKLSIPGVKWDEIPIVSHERGDKAKFGKNKHIEEILPMIVKNRPDLKDIDFSKPENKKLVMLVEDSESNIEHAETAGYAVAAQICDDLNYYYRDNAYLQDLMVEARFTVEELAALQKEMDETKDDRLMTFVQNLVKAVTPKLPAPKVDVKDAQEASTAANNGVSPSFAVQKPIEHKHINEGNHKEPQIVRLFTCPFEKIKELLLKDAISCLDLSNNKEQIGPLQANEITAAIKSNRRLEAITFVGNRLGPEGTKYLADALKVNKSIKRLNVALNQLGPEGGQYLAEALTINHSISEIDLSFNDVGCEAEKHLALALKNNHSLKILDLSQNNGSCDRHTQQDRNFGIFIAEIIKTNDTLTELHCRYNFIQPWIGNLIGDALKDNRSLVSLDLRGNSFGTSLIGEVPMENRERLRGIANGLQFNTTLTSLNLSSNGLNGEAFALLGESLKINKGLIHLDLSYNNLGIKGSQYVADGLKENTALVFLNLSSCSIEDKGAECIFHALKSNQTLEILDLGCNSHSNNPSSKLGAEIAECLKVNRALFKIHLSNHHLDIESGHIIAEGIKDNTTLMEIRLESLQIPGPLYSKIAAEMEAHLNRYLHRNHENYIQQIKNEMVAIEAGMQHSFPSENTPFQTLKAADFHKHYQQLQDCRPMIRQLFKKIDRFTLVYQCQNVANELEKEARALRELFNSIESSRLFQVRALGRIEAQIDAQEKAFPGLQAQAKPQMQIQTAVQTKAEPKDRKQNVPLLTQYKTKQQSQTTQKNGKDAGPKKDKCLVM